MKQLDLAEDITGCIVKRRCSYKDDPLAAAYLCQLFISYVHLGTKAVGFINEYIFVLMCSLLDKVIQFAQRLGLGGYFEIAENVRPGAGVVLIQETGRSDNKIPAVKLVCQHC
ncbi:MAG: hypothetical protein DDT31_01942 [Syntrophomonadaceae bacterium]|nr:hypothetical protein [Bacillota bacterium]